MIIFAYGIVKCLLDKTFKTILRIFYQYRPRFHTETRRANQAREQTEEIIDSLYEPIKDKFPKKPKTYREQAR